MKMKKNDPLLYWILAEEPGVARGIMKTLQKNNFEFWKIIVYVSLGVPTGFLKKSDNLVVSSKTNPD